MSYEVVDANENWLADIAFGALEKLEKLAGVPATQKWLESGVIDDAQQRDDVIKELIGTAWSWLADSIKEADPPIIISE